MTRPAKTKEQLSSGDLQRDDVFLLFPFLPLEVQKMIWEENVAAATIIRIAELTSRRMIRGEQWTVVSLEKIRPHSALHACKTARVFTLPCVQKHAIDNGSRYIYVSHDTTFLFTDHRQPIGFFNFVPRTNAQKEFFKTRFMKKIAVDNAVLRTDKGARSSVDMKGALRGLLREFHSLEELVIIKPDWGTAGTGTFKRNVKACIKRLEESMKSLLQGFQGPRALPSSPPPSLWWSNPVATFVMEAEFYASRTR